MLALVIILSVTLYMVLTGVAIYMVCEVQGFENCSKTSAIRKIVGIVLVGWLIALFYFVMIIATVIIAILDRIFRLNLNC